MHYILHALQSSALEAFGDHDVVADRHSLSGHLAEATLVNEVSHTLQVRISVSNEGFYQAKHLVSGSVEADEHAIVDLSQAEQLKNLLHLGGNVQDTSHTDHKHEPAFIRDEDLALGLCQTAVVDSISLELNIVNFYV